MEACNGVAECDLFVFNPLGKSFNLTEPNWATSAFMKTARNPNASKELQCVLPLWSLPSRCLAVLVSFGSIQSVHDQKHVTQLKHFHIS